jgi:hypothetical protein
MREVIHQVRKNIRDASLRLAEKCEDTNWWTPYKCMIRGISRLGFEEKCAN